MLGWHHCRYGYKNIEEVEWVIDGYKKANIPCKYQSGIISNNRNLIKKFYSGDRLDRY